jgi:hypothetical protein
MHALRQHAARQQAVARFGKFKEEDRQLARSQVSGQGAALASLIGAWEGMEWPGNFEIFLPQNFAAASGRVRGLDYAPEDVKLFCAALAAYADMRDFAPKAGIFISGLVGACKEDSFDIFIGHLEGSVDYLGTCNSKQLIVSGDAGRFFGHGMRAGRMELHGNAGWGAGSAMAGGEIAIHGDCGHYLGDGMSGGSITVLGNARDGIGDFMKDGEISLEGGIGALGNCIRGGRILHRGEQVPRPLAR